MQAWKVKKTTKERYEFTRSFFYSIFTTTRVLAHSFSSASRLWLGAAKKKNPGRLKSIIHLFPSCSIYAPIARITRKATRWKGIKSTQAVDLVSLHSMTRFILVLGSWALASLGIFCRAGWWTKEIIGHRMDQEPSSDGKDWSRFATQ